MQCTNCSSFDIHFDNSQAVCHACGQVLEESQIVSDVTFGENAAGGATVHGSYIASDQTHVRSGNPRFRSGAAGESRDHTYMRAREAIDRMGRAHGVTPHVRERAFRWFRIALEGNYTTHKEANGQIKNYVLGRKQEYTTASCLYVACREQKSSHMLIDFADTMNINVFVLGRHYLKLSQIIGIRLPVLDPSIYLIRFAALLDFGEETNKVAADATRLVRRFKQDWLSDGRRPAGICGACLLLAARMNNFRRSMSEIVQVVKMADVTIRQRLEEFKRTPSGQLTVEDFKNVWLAEEHEPPAFYRPKLEEEKKRLKEAKAEEARARKRLRGDNTEAGEAEEAEAEGDEDEEGNEADREDDAGPSFSKPRRTRQPELPELPAELDSLAEQATEAEIGRYTQEPVFQRMDSKIEGRNAASQARAIKGGLGVYASKGAPGSSSQQVKANGSHLSPSAVKQSSSQQPGLQAGEDASEDAGRPSAHAGPSRAPAGPLKSSQSDAGNERLRKEAEEPFDALDDLDEDELDQFILGEREVEIKTRVWMEFNHDYLRAALRRQLKEEADEKQGIRKKTPRKRNGPGGILGGKTEASAAEATQAMLAKKRFSRKINYDAIHNLFPGSATDSIGDSVFGGDAFGISNSGNSKSKSKKNRKRKSRKDNVPDAQDGDESESAVASRYFGEGVEDLEVVEEAGDTLPSNHALARRESRAERRNKEAKRNRLGQSEDGAPSSRKRRRDDEDGGASSSGREMGTQFQSEGEEGGTTTGVGEDDDDEDEANEASGLLGIPREFNMYYGGGVDDEDDGEEYE